LLSLFPSLSSSISLFSPSLSSPPRKCRERGKRNGRAEGNSPLFPPSQPSRPFKPLCFPLPTLSPFLNPFVHLFSPSRALSSLFSPSYTHPLLHLPRAVLLSRPLLPLLFLPSLLLPFFHADALPRSSHSFPSSPLSFYLLSL
jgi:hypothetical protein